MKTHIASDSKFIHLNGVRVHYQESGQGHPSLILLHGSFLSHFSWRHVVEPLARHRKVVTFDRIAFGQTERPLFRCWTKSHIGCNPYTPEAQADLTIALMDNLGIDQTVLVGNSTGGTIALLTALRHPQRIQALIIVGGMVYSGYPVSTMPAWVKSLLPTWFGPLVVRTAIGRAYTAMIRSFWYDPFKLPSEVLSTYRSLLQIDQWEHAIWELIQATHHLSLESQLSSLRIPILVVSGEKDRTVPLEQSIRLVKALPHPSLGILPDCGHLPQEECPESFLRVAQRFLENLS
jgi:pimeloyl-ACP methyl ester carboxylesterase